MRCQREEATNKEFCGSKHRECGQEEAEVSLFQRRVGRLRGAAEAHRPRGAGASGVEALAGGGPGADLTSWAPAHGSPTEPRMGFGLCTMGSNSEICVLKTAPDRRTESDVGDAKSRCRRPQGTRRGHSSSVGAVSTEGQEFKKWLGDPQVA